MGVVEVGRRCECDRCRDRRVKFWLLNSLFWTLALIRAKRPQVLLHSAVYLLDADPAGLQGSKLSMARQSIREGDAQNHRRNERFGIAEKKRRGSG